MENIVRIYLFYGDTCPICKNEKEYLKELKLEYANIEIYEYEVYRNQENREKLEYLKELYSMSRDGVPFTIIGDTAILGYSDSYKSRFEYLVKKYSKESYIDRVGEYLGLDEILTENYFSSVVLSSNEVKENVGNNDKLTIKNDFIIPVILVILIAFYLFLSVKTGKNQTKI